MVSGGWFKTIISRKKVNRDTSKNSQGSFIKKSNGFKWMHSKNGVASSLLPEDAAKMIQSAFRAYKARKALRCLKGMERLRSVTKCNSTEKQTSIALNYVQTWSRIQAQISARRLSMVIEGRIKQRKLENQLKLEAKLHDLEVDWCGGSETMEEILARIQQREEAAVKRERTLAYAFSHQWRPNSGQNLGRFAYEIAKDNWGWSWMERWIAVRPWEIRLLGQALDHHKTQRRAASKAGNKANPSAKKAPNLLKPGVAPKERTTTKKNSTPMKVEDIKPKVAKVDQEHQESETAG